MECVKIAETARDLMKRRQQSIRGKKVGLFFDGVALKHRQDLQLKWNKMQLEKDANSTLKQIPLMSSSCM